MDTMPYGRVPRELVEPFLPTKTVPWLELGAGCAGASLGPDSSHYYEVGHAAGGVCEIRTSFDINVANHGRVGVFVDGFHATNAGMAPGLYIKDLGTPAARGVSIWTPPNATHATFRAFGSGQADSSISYTWGGTEAGKRRNVGLVVEPASKRVSLVADDQVIWWDEVPNLQLGRVRFGVSASQAAPLTNGKIRMAQFRVMLEHN
jgi:hypothetical protein